MFEAIIFAIIVSIGSIGCWMAFKTEQGIKRLEKETGKSYRQLKAEFYDM